MTGSRPTLEDVAKQAKVSTATVSRCFNAPERVRPALRQRVRDAVEALGYTPHGAARALASHRSNTIGAVVPTLDNAIFATVIETLQQQLSAAGRTLLVASSNYDPARERDQIETLIVRGVDGLMLTGETRDRIAETAVSVWLRASLDTLVKRVERSRTRRPLLETGDPRQILSALVDERYPVYEQANIIVDTGEGPHEPVVETIVQELRAHWRAQEEPDAAATASEQETASAQETASEQENE